MAAASEAAVPTSTRPPHLKGTPAVSRREKLASIQQREKDKDLLATKYREKYSAAPITEANVARILGSSEQKAGLPDYEALSEVSVSAYTTGTSDKAGSSGRKGSLTARQRPPIANSVRIAGGSLSARGPKVAIGGPSDKALMAKPQGVVFGGALEELMENSALASPLLSPPPEHQADDGSAEQEGLEWSVLDKLAAQLHKQDTANAKHRELELRRRLKNDLDKQVADEKLKQERAREEELNMSRMEADKMQMWSQEIEEKAKERQEKMLQQKRERDDQVSDIRARREQERLQEQRDSQELISSISKDLERDKQASLERSKARIDLAQQALKVNSEALRMREEQQKQAAIQEAIQAEAYNRVKAEREDAKAKEKDKERLHRLELERRAAISAETRKNHMDNAESKAMAERRIKDQASEAAEKASQQKLQSMKKKTQEYLLMQIEEKHHKKSQESERVKQLAMTQAVEEKKSQDKEAEKQRVRRKLNWEHRQELERQMAVKARGATHKEVMSESELRLNKHLLEKVSLALTDISGGAGAATM